MVSRNCLAMARKPGLSFKLGCCVPLATAIAFRRLEPITAPTPFFEAMCPLSKRMPAYRTTCSPAGPMLATLMLFSRWPVSLLTSSHVS